MNWNLNWNYFADQILRQGEAAFRSLCDDAGQDADAIIAVETARQQADRLDVVAKSLAAEGLDMTVLAAKVTAEKAAMEEK